MMEVIEYSNIAGERICAILSQDKLYFSIHVLVVDRFTYLIIDATSLLKAKEDSISLICRTRYQCS